MRNSYAPGCVEGASGLRPGEDLSGGVVDFLLRQPDDDPYLRGYARTLALKSHSPQGA